MREINFELKTLISPSNINVVSTSFFSNIPIFRVVKDLAIKSGVNGRAWVWTHCTLFKPCLFHSNNKMHKNIKKLKSAINCASDHFFSNKLENLIANDVYNDVNLSFYSTILWNVLFLSKLFDWGRTWSYLGVYGTNLF